MARLSDVQRQVLGQWWTLAEAGAYQGFLSTDVISAAADIASQYGETLSFSHAGALSTLYGYGRRMANAANTLRATQDSDVIDHTMIGVPPWARDQEVMNTTPIWHVSYDFTYLDSAGNIQTDIRTSVFEMALPDTVGELAATLEDDAQSLADKYNVQFIEANLREILAV